MFEISVLASGTGTTFDNLASHCETGILAGKVKIKYLITDRICPALDIAKQRGIANFVIDRHLEQSKYLFPADVDLHVMAGFLSKVSVPEWAVNRIVNIHPSLLPTYGGKGMYGKRVHQAVIDNRELITGCTVHLVDDEYDHGTILEQAQMAVLFSDNASTLEIAVKRLESQLYPRAILNYLNTLKHRYQSD
jgi:phosphoribosylglycinamide formyltransferase 1